MSTKHTFKHQDEPAQDFALPTKINTVIRKCLDAADGDRRYGVELLALELSSSLELQAWAINKCARVIMGEYDRGTLQEARRSVSAKDDDDPAPAKVYTYDMARSANTIRAGLLAQYLTQVGKQLSACTRSDMDSLIEANAKRMSAASINVTFYSKIKERLDEDKTVGECFTPEKIDALWRKCLRKAE